MTYGNVNVTIWLCRRFGNISTYRGNPVSAWFRNIDAIAAAKVAAALVRMEMGNFSNVKTLGSGISEYRIDFGPGYRIYFGKEGNELIVLLGGGTKKRQQEDVRRAVALWRVSET